MKRHRWLCAAVLPAALLAACGGSGGRSASASAKASAGIASVAVATVAPATPTPAPTATPAGVAYTVKSGDTLSKIAAANGSTVDAIVKANNLSDPDKLQVGQQLTIPGAAASASASAGGLPAAASKPPPP